MAHDAYVGTGRAANQSVYPAGHALDVGLAGGIKRALAGEGTRKRDVKWPPAP